MDPAPARNARRVQWVSFSKGEAKTGLAFTKAISRENGVGHWHLRPAVDLMEPTRAGWLLQRGVPGGTCGHQEQFGLSEDYPWFIGSRRAVGVPQKHLAGGGSRLASSEAFSEQFFCASSAGLLGLLLDWEKNCHGAHKQAAAHLLQDWLAKCLVKVKTDGFSGWKPPAVPPPCQSPETHGGIRKAKMQTNTMTHA